MNARVAAWQKGAASPLHQGAQPLRNHGRERHPSTPGLGKALRHLKGARERLGLCFAAAGVAAAAVPTLLASVSILASRCESQDLVHRQAL
eukprot:15275480-Alexandrium_andersonii.AAC.1